MDAITPSGKMSRLTEEMLSEVRVCKGPIGFLSFSARNETNFGISKGFLWFEANSEELQASEQREKGKEIAR